jgi:actin-like ATPase involved in cell morphogenesis
VGGVDVRRYGGAVLGYTASSLGIDLGTTHTVASLAVRGTQVQQLLFDSSPLLSSAVFAEEGRPLVAGRDAERGARLDPTRFEPNPKRRIDDGTVLLGSREYPVAELLAAILRRVADEAGRVGGGSPGTTVLTYPANWATTRRTVLAEAAHLAGLRSLTLVPEPVAAAAYFTTVLGRPVPAGAGLVVYDFGAGTFDTSVLRRRPDQGWDVLASDGIDVGGLDLDAVLVDLIGEAMSTRDAALWTRLRQSDEENARRARRALWDDARAAKEQLSRAPSAAVHVPLFDTNAHVTREQFEERARPWIARTVELTEALLARTGLAAGQVAGLFLVGGSSRIPLVGTMLHQRLGIAPTVIEQPELVVALGSLAAVPAAEPPAPVSAAPASPGPAYPVPPPLPVSAAPASPTPDAATTRSVPLAPVWPEPPTRPHVSDRMPRRRARPLALTAAAAALVLMAAGGIAGYQWLADRSDSKKNAGDPGSITVNDKPKVEEADPGADRQTAKIDKTVWYGGRKMTFGTAEYDASKDPPLTVGATVQNLANQGAYPGVDMVLNVDGESYEGFTDRFEPVPALATGTVTYGFRVQEPPSRLADAVLTVGRAGELQAVLPFGDKAKLVSLEPKTVLENKTVSAGALTMEVTRCEIRPDNLDNGYQVKDGQRHLACLVTITYHGASGRPGGQNIDDRNNRLKLPDKVTVEAPTDGANDLLGAEQVARDKVVLFTLRWPAPGQYALQLLDLGWLNNDPPSAKNTREIAFTIDGA